jgi:hypothetical protein
VVAAREVCGCGKAAWRGGEANERGRCRVHGRGRVQEGVDTEGRARLKHGSQAVRKRARRSKRYEVVSVGLREGEGLC